MDICRVCLSLSPEKDIKGLKPTKSQEPKSSTEIFEFCLNIEVTEDPKITTKLCTKCYQKVLSYYKFKILALKSDKYLRSNASNTNNDPIKLKDTITASNAGLNDTGDDFNNLIFNIGNTDEPEIKAECLESDGSNNEIFNCFDAKTEIEDTVLYRPGGSDAVQSATDTIDTMQTENVGEKGAPSPKKPKLDDNQSTAVSQDIKLERDSSTSKIINTEDKSEEDVSLDIDKFEMSRIKLELDNNNGKEITHKIAYNNMADQKPTVTTSDDKTSCTIKKLPNSSILTCDICEYNTGKIKSLNSHLKAHAATKRYSCNSCLYITTDLRHLTQHIVRHSGEKPHSCNVCDKTFNYKVSLNRHIRVHTGEKPYSCNTCDKPFADRAKLDRHIVITHTACKPHSCSICDKTFTDKGSLNRHVRAHTGEKPYSCNVCDKKFSSKSYLVTHVRVHTGEKPYSCNTCDKKFTKRTNLVTHLRVHTGEKPYSCNTCNKKFSDKTSLNRHVWTHTREKRYACNTCHKKFSDKTNLNRHVTAHTDE